MLRRGLILGVLLSGALALHAGEVLDRIVTTVNGHVILQSDWQEEICYESFVSGRPLTAVTAQDRKDSLDRLIDHELLREQMSGVEFKATTAEEVEKQFEMVKGDYAQAHGAQPWSETLASYRLTEADIKSHITLELTQLRLVDAHLRPAIQVDAVEVEAYYKEHLTSPAAGTQQISLQQATPRIRELLIQEKINQSLSSWLESLRSQAEIRMFLSDSSGAQGPAQ